MFQLLLRVHVFHSRFQWLFLQTAHIAPCRSPADSKTKFFTRWSEGSADEARSAALWSAPLTAPLMYDTKRGTGCDRDSLRTPAQRKNAPATPHIISRDPSSTTPLVA